MKIFNVLIVVMFPLAVLAQETPLVNLYQKYVDKPGFSTTEIDTRDVSFEWEKEQGTEGIREFLDNLEGIRIISLGDDEPEARMESGEFYEKIMKALEKEPYTEVLSVVDGDEKVFIYFLRADDILHEAALVVKDESKATLITMTGNIDLASLMNKETWKGLKYLHKKDSGEGCEGQDGEQDE